jgi:hypothetical protein
MINLNSLIKYKEIESLGYSTTYIEQPVPNIADFDWKKILEAPPSNMSKETFLELQLISRATLQRTSEDTKLVEIIDQDTDSVFIELLNQYGLEYPQSKILEFYSIIKPIILNIKSLWNRPRPAQLAKYYDLNIDVIVTDTHHTAAYPSGHTVYSSLISHIIQYYYPTVDKKKLESLVKDTEKARILQGVHYPSDNLASIKLTKFLFNKLKERIL